jgi:hypothetical protein
MKQIGRLLKHGGFALLEFPNTASIPYLVKRLKKNLGSTNTKYSDSWRPGHCNEFCRRAFNFLLGETSFELVDWRTYSHKRINNLFYRLVPVGNKARALVRKVG